MITTAAMLYNGLQADVSVLYWTGLIGTAFFDLLLIMLSNPEITDNLREN